MFFYIINAASLVAEAFGGCFATEAFDESLRWAADDTWEFDLVDSLQNDVVRLHRISGREWRSTTKQQLNWFNHG